MNELKYYCKTCRCGYQKSQWKKITLIDPSILGGSYAMLVECPKGH